MSVFAIAPRKLENGVMVDATNNGLPISYEDALRLQSELQEYLGMGKDWINQNRQRQIIALEQRQYMRFKETEKPDKDRSGYVYLIQSPTSAYKIGKTVDPDNRIKTFSVKLPFEVDYVCVIETGDMNELESNLHEMFEHKRLDGEWFDLSDEDVEYIKSLAVAS